MIRFSSFARSFTHLGVIAGALACLASSATADVTLPKIFGDHMLLQRGLDAPVWGWADAGERVTVKFADQQHQTTADEHGRWMVHLDPMSASDQGQSLTVAGNNEIRFNDILVGDVWICSGQSNMELPTNVVINAQQEVESADYPEIRLFDVPGHTTSPLPKDDVPGGTWQPCSPQSVAGFSAVGYFFGRDFHRETGVPIGLIGTNWGGTRIEPWTPPVGFRSVPALQAISESVDRFDVATEQGKQTWNRYAEAIEGWARSAKQALQDGTTLSAPPETPGFKNANEPTTIYNAMVHGLAPYGIRGAIWYQGESNGGEGVEYFHKMQALIEGWRQVWNQAEFPIYFYFVQLADFQQPNNDPAGGDGWARLREAQLQSLSIKNTGMAVITDIGQANDIHPRNKQDVGYRLALWRCAMWPTKMWWSAVRCTTIWKSKTGRFVSTLTTSAAD